jgi:hypothetical protein
VPRAHQWELVVTESDERIHAIEDRSQIVELTARHCQMARTGDVVGIVELFCGDRVMPPHLKGWA